MEITPLRAIIPHRHKYTIRVRVSRIWRPRWFNIDSYDGLHYVLVDENGDSIHALINEEQHDDMSQKVELGQLYDIYHFSTHEDLLPPGVLKNEMVLHFNGSTQFVKLDEILPPIPQHSLRPIEFERLEEEQQNKETLTDIYGCIKTIRTPYQQPLRTRKNVETKCDINVQNLSYRVKLTIEDKESQATLTLMGRQAEEFFNSKCGELLEKWFYPAEQSLPEEIVDKVGKHTYLK